MRLTGTINQYRQFCVEHRINIYYIFKPLPPLPTRWYSEAHWLRIAALKDKWQIINTDTTQYNTNKSTGRTGEKNKYNFKK